MNKFTIIAALLVLSTASLAISKKGSSQQLHFGPGPVKLPIALSAISNKSSIPQFRFGPGPVKPWGLASCTNPVIAAAPIFGQFANDTINQNVEQLCLDVAALQESLYNISRSCLIGDFQYANTTGTLNATALLYIADSLLDSAEDINENPTPVSGISNDIQNFINNYDSLAANCN